MRYIKENLFKGSRKLRTAFTSLFIVLMSTAIAFADDASDITGYDMVYEPIWSGEDGILAYVTPVFSLILAISAIYCIVLGVKYIKAEDPGEREKAKTHIKNLIIGWICLFIILVLWNFLLPFAADFAVERTKDLDNNKVNVASDETEVNYVMSDSGSKSVESNIEDNSSKQNTTPQVSTIEGSGSDDLDMTGAGEGEINNGTVTKNLNSDGSETFDDGSDENPLAEALSQLNAAYNTCLEDYNNVNENPTGTNAGKRLRTSLSSLKSALDTLNAAIAEHGTTEEATAVVERAEDLISRAEELSSEDQFE